MDKVNALEVVRTLGEQHGRADYILGEVYAHLMTNTTPETDKDFRFWFLRQWAKYQKGV